MLTIFGLVFIILQINSATCQFRTDRLVLGQRLERGQNIVSRNGWYSLVVRFNGNLAILDFFRNRVLAEQETFGLGDFFIMQRDGNAVLYGINGGIWYQTRTGGRNASHIMIENNGDLTIFNFSNQRIWTLPNQGFIVAISRSEGVNSTNLQVAPFPKVKTRKEDMGILNKGNDRDKMFTGQSFNRNDNNYLESENGMYTLGFLGDGYFGIQEKNGKSLWKIGAGSADSIVFHPDGNLALFANISSEKEYLLWESNTKEEDGVKIKVLWLKNDGNLVILDENNKVKWQSGTVQRKKSDRTVMRENWRQTTTTTTTESTTTTKAVARSVDFDNNGSDWFVKNWDDGNIAVVLPLAVDGLDDATKNLVMTHVKSNEKLGDVYAKNKFVYSGSWINLIKRIAGNITPTLFWEE